MPTTKVKAGFNVRYRHSAFERTTDVEVYLESDAAIKAYVMSKDDLDDFDNSEPFDYFAHCTVDGSRTMTARIPPNTRWFLLLVNRTREAAAVHWEVRA